MNELELIERLTQKLPRRKTTPVGPGDDCAVLDLGMPGEFLLFKTDATVEGVHFLPGTLPEKIGHKALARALSDIAAMGGTPLSALVSLGLPPKFEVEYLEGLYAGMTGLGSRHEVDIVGGETTANPDGLWIVIALVGSVPREHCLLRSGAKVGDALFVTGELGGSIAGKHLDFEPRLEQARWLAKNFPISAMIDLSDGLASDLRHVLKASHVGASLLSKAIPISAAAHAKARAESAAKTPLLAALTDGEDFELLFTLGSASAVKLLDAWKQQFPALRLSCIGKINSEPGLKLQDKNGVREFGATGYAHFK